jgi:hypothetical protein
MVVSRIGDVGRGDIPRAVGTVRCGNVKRRDGRYSQGVTHHQVVVDAELAAEGAGRYVRTGGSEKCRQLR